MITLKWIQVIGLFPFLFHFSADAADNLTGRVVTGTNTALASAKVWLKNQPQLFDSTGSDGTFSLPLTPTSVRFSHAEGMNPAGFQLRHNQLFLSLENPQNLIIELYKTRGEKAVTLFKGQMDAGNHGIVLNENNLVHSPGQYFLRTRIGAKEFTQVVHLSASHELSLDLPTPQRHGDKSLSKAAADADTLIVLRMGYEIKKWALPSVTAKDFGDLSLTPRTFKRDAALEVKTGRRVEVYTPSDYKDLYLLPVLYLVHGGGANETYWRVNCKFLDSLNSFTDRVNVQPMIIVTPSAGGNTNYGNYGKTADPFYADLTTDIRAYIESHYKVDTARTSRAISGLSMGSMQTWNLTLFYPKLWGYSLPMSGGLFKSSGFSVAKFKSDVSSKVVDVSALNEIKLFKVYSNPTDAAYGDTDTTSRLADSLGIHHAKDFTTKTMGGHTDPYWNEVFRKYAPILFKE